MATASSTRPPTSGEASSPTEGAPASEVPIADVADWGQALPEAPPEVKASEEAGTSSAAPSGQAVGESNASVIVDPAQLTTHPSVQPLPGVNTPPPGSPLPVLVLVDQARQAEGEERQELSRRINRWLDKMVREGGSRQVADWFHHLIESGRLEGLEDAAGRGCHETAVRGLLSMGFPYALEVRPEDLERIQPRPDSRKARRHEANLKGTLAAVVLGGAVGEFLLNLLRGRHVAASLTAEVGVAALALVALLLSQPRTPLRSGALVVLAIASLFSFLLGATGVYAGMVSGLAGLVAVLLFALHRS